MQAESRSVDEDNIAAAASDDDYAPVWVPFSLRTPPPRDRRRMWALLALVLVGHVLMAWLVYFVARVPPRSGHGAGVFTVTLIEPAPEFPPPPPLVPPPPLSGQPPARTSPRVPRAPGSIGATLENTQGQPLDLYGVNGQIRLPATSATAPPAPAYSAPALQASRIYSGKSPIPYKPTRFNKDWAPLNQTLGGKLYDKVVDKTTLQKTVKLPLGIKLHCIVSPLMLAFGCPSAPPPPPPKNDGDIRLSMPPPETLTGKKVVVPGTSSSVARPAASGHR
jgi:hypothetical protein